MADHCDHGTTIKTEGSIEIMGKKEEEKKPQEEDAISNEFEQKIHVEEKKEKEHQGKEEKKHEGLLEKLTRSDSRSSSSDEEEIEGGEKKKKKKNKKGLKDKIKGEISGDEHKEEEDKVAKHDEKHEDAKCDAAEAEPSEEKKGFFGKIMEKFQVGTRMQRCILHHQLRRNMVKQGEEGHLGEDQGEVTWVPPKEGRKKGE